MKKSMSLTIRRATIADRETLVAFNAALAWESEGKRLHEEILREGIEAVFGDPAKGFYVVAERDGQIVGQSAITFEWSDWRNGWHWWIQSVYVREDARRGGVFTAIYKHLETAALADPAVIGIRLYVEKQNARAQAVYRNLGLVEEDYFLMGRYPLPGKASHIESGSH
jgi:ribosomal protein S18 acetylase RimI-like enzyme